MQTQIDHRKKRADRSISTSAMTQNYQNKIKWYLIPNDCANFCFSIPIKKKQAITMPN